MTDRKSASEKPPPLLRPQSAVGSKHFVETPKPPAPNNTFRPWTTHPRQRGELSQQKILRQSHHLKKSHLRAVGRQHESEASKIGSDFPSKTPMGLEYRAEQAGLEVVTAVSLMGDCVTSETASAEGSKRSRPKKRHPSFDAWVSGSPHDSDEYNTDLEDEGGQKENKNRQQTDASGVQVYEEQCRKHGFVPVSYLRRHLNKRTIRMRHRYLGGSAARPLAYAFRHNTITETVDLSDNYLQSSGAAYLASMLRDNTFIVSLNLSNNFIASSGCAALAEMLDVNTTLKTLNLSGNQLNDPDVHHFIEPLRNNMSLTCLDLSHNNLAEMSGLHLAAALSMNDGINDLDISWNSIRKNGAVALANALKVNTFLEVLDISWNGLGSEGALALQAALQVNSTLKVLDLTNNRIDSKSAVKLAAGLKKNSGLETLILDLNPIGDSGMEAILNAVAVHPSLKFLSLENCGELGTSDEDLQYIKELEKEKSLIILHGGSGGYQRLTSLMRILQLFGQFCKGHMTDLDTAFQQQDRDHSGVLAAEETKQCLRTAGLRLTSRQLEAIIAEIDYSHSGRIQYRDILSGAAFTEHHKRRPSRAFGLIPGTGSTRSKV